MVDTDRGSIVAVNLAPALDGYPLADELGRRFGLPVRLDHHPRALLVGDRWFGAGRGVRQFAVVYTGEVLGGALYFDGHLYRGAAGAGGELGHTFVQVDGELCRCGRRGCWDTIATLELAAARGAAGRLCRTRPDRLRPVSCDMAARRLPGAAELFDRYARNVAVGIANLQQTVAPNIFILHGDVVLGGDAHARARSRIMSAPWCRHGPAARSRSLPAMPATRAALLGAAGLVLSELLQFAI